MTAYAYEVPPPADFVDAWRAVFERQKAFAEHAIGQVDDGGFFRSPGDGLNAIAVIVQHMAGNLRSRFTDFLTSDGEKPWRDREAEFASPDPTPEERARIMDAWERGWAALFTALDGLGPEDLGCTVAIRTVPHAVHAAIARSLDHMAHHVGQINVIARLQVGSSAWRWFTVAPGETERFNRRLMGTDGPGA